MTTHYQHSSIVHEREDEKRCILDTNGNEVEIPDFFVDFFEIHPGQRIEVQWNEDSKEFYWDTLVNHGPRPTREE